MTDLSATIAPKSDQLNSDDLIGGPRTICVTRVTATSTPEQPIAIYFEGDNNKPYKPGKSMRRVLVKLWGPDGNAYVGRSMTLYRDDKVIFGGLEVGGIRISHLSDIKSKTTMALTASKAARKPFTVDVLRVAPPARPAAVEADAAAFDEPPVDKPKIDADRFIAKLGEFDTAAALGQFLEGARVKDFLGKLKESRSELALLVQEAEDKRFEELQAAEPATVDA